MIIRPLKFRQLTIPTSSTPEEISKKGGMITFENDDGSITVQLWPANGKHGIALTVPQTLRGTFSGTIAGSPTEKEGLVKRLFG